MPSSFWPTLTRLLLFAREGHYAQVGLLWGWCKAHCKKNHLEMVWATKRFPTWWTIERCFGKVVMDSTPGWTANHPTLPGGRWWTTWSHCPGGIRWPDLQADPSLVQLAWDREGAHGVLVRSQAGPLGERESAQDASRGTLGWLALLPVGWSSKLILYVICLFVSI